MDPLFFEIPFKVGHDKENETILIKKDRKIIEIPLQQAGIFQQWFCLAKAELEKPKSEPEEFEREPVTVNE